MLRCHLEADGEREGKKNKYKSERGIKSAKKSNKEISRQSTNDLGTKQQADLSSPCLPDLSFLF